jgi:hypothetical protein
MDVAVQLKEWTQIFLKNRDVMEQVITGFESVDGDFIVHKKAGEVLFLIRPELKDVGTVVEKAKGKTGLVVLNTKKNVGAVVAGWDKLKQLPGLCIYFVNPDTNDKWLLYPHTHDKITEKSALKRGLESLFSMVPAYD